MTDRPRYLTAADVSTMLGIHPDHWRDRASKRRGVPAPYRIGGALRWREDEIADWLESTRVRSRGQPKRPARDSAVSL